jgi:hypothetical protein
MAKKEKTILVDNQPTTMPEILARCPHLSRSAARKRLDCYAPTWAKLEAPLLSQAEILARGRKITDRAYTELTPNW